MRVDAVTAHEPPEAWAWASVDLTHTGDPVTDHHIAEQGAQDLIADVSAGLEPTSEPSCPRSRCTYAAGDPARS